MWKKLFCLDIKKFWYSCEKDNYNDVNKHLFAKNVSTEKYLTLSRIELMISPTPSLLWSTAPPCHLCNWMQELINISNLPSTCFFLERTFSELSWQCVLLQGGRGEGFTVNSTYKQVNWHWWADFWHIDNTHYWLHYLQGKTYCPGGYESQCKA